MKLTRLKLCTFGLLAITVFSQIISCGSKKDPTPTPIPPTPPIATYDVSVVSPSNMFEIDNKKATDHTTFTTNFSIKEEFINTYLLPHTVQKITVGEQPLKANDYTYTVDKSQKSASLTINADVVTNNIQINLNFEKGSLVLNDYCYVYVNDTVELSLSLTQGEYMVAAKIPDSSALKIAIKATDVSFEKRSYDFFELKNKEPVLAKFVVSKADGKSINDYLTFSVVKVINNGSLTLSIDNTFNKKMLCFSFNFPINQDKETQIIPIVDKGISYIKSPNDHLKDLFSNNPRLIYDKDKQSYFNLIKRQNFYVTALRQQTVSNKSKCYFLAYCDDIPVARAEIRIAAGVSSSSVAINSASVCSVYFYKSNLGKGLPYRVANRECVSCVNVIDANSYNLISNSDSFTVPSEKTAGSVYVHYDLTKGQKLSDCWCCISYEQTEKTIQVFLDNKNNTFQYFSPSGRSLAVIDDRQFIGDYTYLIQEELVAKDQKSIVDEQSFIAPTIELSSKKTVRGLKFSKVYEGNNTRYYAAKYFDEDKNIPYLKPEDGTKQVSLNNLSVKYNNNVRGGETLTISAQRVCIFDDSKYADDFRFASVGLMDYHTAITGVPYACKIMPKNPMFDVNLDKLDVKIGGTSIAKSFDKSTHILSFTVPSNLHGALEIDLELIVGKIKIEVEKPGDRPTPVINVNEIEKSQKDPINITASFDKSVNLSIYAFTNNQPSGWTDKSGRGVTVTNFVYTSLQTISFTLNLPEERDFSVVTLAISVGPYYHTVKYDEKSSKSRIDNNPGINIENECIVDVHAASGYKVNKDKKIDPLPTLLNTGGEGTTITATKYAYLQNDMIRLTFPKLKKDVTYNLTNFLLPSLDDYFVKA